MLHVPAHVWSEQSEKTRFQEEAGSTTEVARARKSSPPASTVTPAARSVAALSSKPQFGRSGSFHNTAPTAIPLLPVQTILLCLVSHNAMENIKVLCFLIDLPCNKHLPCLLGRAGGRKIFYSLKTSCGQLLIRHIATLKCGSYKPVSENANLLPAVTVKFLLETLQQSLALQYFISWGFWHCNILALV